MKISREYMLKEINKFWEIMGDRQFTVEQVSNALRGLLATYLQCQEDDKLLESAIFLACEEHDRRLALRLQHGI